MARIVISENVSLDGVMDDPTGEEGTRHGGWFLECLNGDQDAWADHNRLQALGFSGILLGRRSDEYFGSRWNAREGEWAYRLNSLPKYVVSSTLEEPVWVNGTVVSGDAVDAVARLKERTKGDLVCFGSRQLARTLLEHDLVDEVRLIVYPVVLGAGGRLFDEPLEKTQLRLVESRTIGDGLPFLRYDVSPRARAAHRA